ncbi:unnamed protein product [Didymodactylos carnosus]|uniref:Bromodomain and PHD finger-containing protein n=1 Tax=Didymodactylos carnosus TaxID=1234261 RepID=A0A813YWA7_9BILA|nr:unnamed protein product [Didymodactylos carnosus]CAF3675173.1 unnamed protein product [Didymodactylos carnosus]
MLRTRRSAQLARAAAGETTKSNPPSTKTSNLSKDESSSSLPSPANVNAAPSSPPHILELNECVGRSIKISINEEIEIIAKHNASPLLIKTQTSDKHEKNDKEEKSIEKEDYSDKAPFERASTFIRYIEPLPNELDEKVEFEMDEMDIVWLRQVNEERSKRNYRPVTGDEFEFIIDRLEKESHFQALSQGDHSSGPAIDEDALCCICLDGECSNCNAILFCDMCNLAVHQECYGVPYVPEGQWLCRRCFLSPSKSVQCVLCPNRFGAFKQTDDGERWAHVVCAIWIPEVHFLNTVFLEPICGINCIPSARWRFTCYVCKQKNVGACIQCSRTSCYAAFHVTCAQQAGLFMEIEENNENECDIEQQQQQTQEKVDKRTNKKSKLAPIKRRAYCHAHTPLEHVTSKTKGKTKKDNETGEEALRRIQKIRMKKARRILAERRKSDRSISVPVIPKEKLQLVLEKVKFSDRNNFIKRIQAYWTLKRMSRSGVPLLKRLQTQRSTKKKLTSNSDGNDKHLAEQLTQWRRLRQDLEKTRLLVELIRKREKLKRDLVKLDKQVLDNQLRPFSVFIIHVLDQLQQLDENQHFELPVDREEVPSYYNFITHPMDFSTMRKKIELNEYENFAQFENDFGLIIKNCHFFNEANTVFYKAATKLRDKGLALLKQARRVYESTQADSNRLSTSLQQNQDDEEEMDDVHVSSTSDNNVSFEERLDVLLQRLKEYNSIGSRSKRVVNLKKQIANVRQKLSKKMSTSSFENDEKGLDDEQRKKDHSNGKEKKEIKDDNEIDMDCSTSQLTTTSVGDCSPTVSSLNMTKQSLRKNSTLDKVDKSESLNNTIKSVLTETAVDGSFTNYQKGRFSFSVTNSGSSNAETPTMSNDDNESYKSDAELHIASPQTSNDSHLPS